VALILGRISRKAPKLRALLGGHLHQERFGVFLQRGSLI
jgi:hypothetical protein